MEEVKKKRGRPKKILVANEISNIILEVQQKEKDLEELEFKEILNEEKKKRNGGWDVTIDEEILFFDRRLSYELTGYKPIDETHGLDFDPEWFCEARNNFLQNGHYTSFIPNTKAYADFWTEEYRRCREGMTVNGYTVTGDHYFFLNYYQLLNLNSVKKAGTSRSLSFPTFYIVLYEWFHYVEMAKQLKLNVALMKARGIGFSEMYAAMAANEYNAFRNSITVIAAQQEIYVTKTLSKVWNALDFLNDYTDGGFFKLRQVKNTELLKKSSYYKILDGQQIETGWKSQIQGIVADKPNKIRGDRTDLLMYEEGGSWPNLKKAFLQGDPLVEIQGTKHGIKLVGGTGGDSGAALEGLSHIYYNPDTYGVLKYRHNFTIAKDYVLTAYFIPSFLVVNDIKHPEYSMDKRGFISEEKGRLYYEMKRDLKAKDPKALLIYCAETCFTAEEAFQLEGDNKFNKIIIADLLASIRLERNNPRVETGNISFLFKNSLHTKENIDGFKWTPDVNGKIHILEHPIWSEEYKNNKKSESEEVFEYSLYHDLYVAGIDAIDIGANQTSELTKNPSDFCIVIKKRAFGNQTPLYVAYYKDRPMDERTAYRTAICLAQYYNARMNIEATRINMVTWAKKEGWFNWFMKRPQVALPQSARSKQTTLIGTQATTTMIDHQTTLIAEFIEEFGYDIWFEEMLSELNSYTDENKGKFDIVAAMGE